MAPNPMLPETLRLAFPLLAKADAGTPTDLLGDLRKLAFPPTTACVAQPAWLVRSPAIRAGLQAA
jgi:hypothetical protein